MVLLSFSPAKLSDASTLEIIVGITRKNGAKNTVYRIYVTN